MSQELSKYRGSVSIEFHAADKEKAEEIIKALKEICQHCCESYVREVWPEHSLSVKAKSHLSSLEPRTIREVRLPSLEELE